MIGDATKEKIRALLDEHVEEVIEKKELEALLLSGKTVTIKLGADPSRPDLHLGHAVVLRKLKEFQELGHKIVFIIGDFTAMIGDPSGRDATRSALDENEIRHNAETYLAQAGKVLDLGRNVNDVHNSAWYNNPGKMSLSQFIKEAGQFSLRRIIDREDFQKRIAAGKEVGLHEALYQVLQAYDSVYIGADVEIGGRDQKLNMLAGRELQKKKGLRPQQVLTTPLLIGLDGEKKMSKSLGNYIGLLDSAEDMFGKVMSVPDTLIGHYADLAAYFPKARIKEIEKIAKKDPKGAKEIVAEAVAALYHGTDDARRAADIFRARHGKEGGVSAAAYIPFLLPRGEYDILTLIQKLGGASSNTEARRLVHGRAVEYNHEILEDTKKKISLLKEAYIRIGKKKFFKIVPQ